jgi:nucleoside-diphosphate-sugar epimerase
VGPFSNTWRLDLEAGPLRHIVDLRDRDAVHRIVKEVRPTVIFNLASHGAYPHQTDAARIFETNVLGLLHLLEACDQIDYRLFIHTGSSSEYGRKSAPMRETDELSPESVYGVSKVAQSLLCQQWSRQRGRPIVVLRLFSVYGPLEEPTRLIPRLVTAMLDNAPLAMVSPRTGRDFVYVDDVVEAMLRIDRQRTTEATKGTVLNLGTGVQTTLADIVSMLESIAGAPFKAEWNAMPARPWDTETWVADTMRLRQALGWVPTVSVRDGLALSIDWFRAYRRFYPAQA